MKTAKRLGKKPKFTEIPKHLDQITAKGNKRLWAYHPTKGWRVVRSTNTYAGRVNIELFLDQRKTMGIGSMR